MLEGDPHLERDRTVCQDLEKMLAPYLVIQWEDKHCSNSWFVFFQKPKTLWFLLFLVSSVTVHSTLVLLFFFFISLHIYNPKQERFNVLTNVFKSPRKMVIFSIDCWDLFVQFQFAWSLLPPWTLPSEDCLPALLREHLLVSFFFIFLKSILFI